MSRYDDEHFLLWFTRPTPTWLELSAEARGVAISVAMVLNPKTGALTLRKGLQSLAILVRIPWEKLEPAIAELIAADKLVWDGSDFVLFDPEHSDRRRKTSTERVQECRARKKAASEPPPAPCNAGNVSSVSPVPCNSETPPLISSSLVSSDLQIPEEIPPARETPDPGRPPPDWWPEALETVAASVEPIAQPGAAWLRYAGHRAGKRLPADRRDAIYWLTSVIVPEQQKARDRDRKDRDRDAAFAAERASGTRTYRVPDTPPAPYHAGSGQKISPEESKRMAAELGARIAARKAREKGAA